MLVVEDGVNLTQKGEYKEIIWTYNTPQLQSTSFGSIKLAILRETIDLVQCINSSEWAAQNQSEMCTKGISLGTYVLLDSSLTGQCLLAHTAIRLASNTPPPLSPISWHHHKNQILNNTEATEKGSNFLACSYFLNFSKCDWCL